MQGEADLFKALSDPTRLRLVVLLALHGEVCVCVRVLRAAGIVETRRDGTWMYYRLAEPRTRLEKCLQECFRDCLNDHETVVADAERLKNATCSKNGE
jgi:ArsR family transcriptional regulator